jgi:hypothetical protein
MTQNEILAIVGKIVSENGGKIIREGYSGRNMYGARCWAVTCDDWKERDRIRDAAYFAGIGSGMVDIMGLEWVIYWPELSWAKRAD